MLRMNTNIRPGVSTGANRHERHTGLTASDLPKPTFQPGSYVYELDLATGLANKLRVGRILGRGGFAKCYEVSDAHGSYALKAINRTSLEKPKTLQKLHTEIAIHRRMKHKHIVNFIRTFKDRYYVYILLEKCDNGTLMDLIKMRALTVPETQYIMLQCLSAMQYMQDQYVIHRDLKPGNIMLDSELNVKIGDFGLAAELQYDGERKRTICGTPNYIAPEIIDRKSHGHSYEVDAWSLGVILFTLLTGNPPFQMEDVESTYARIRQCKYEFPAALSPHARDLVQHILQSSPSQRPTLLDIRTHAFFCAPPPPLLPPSSLATFGLAVPDRQRRGTAPPESLAHAPPAREAVAPNRDAAVGPGGAREVLRPISTNLPGRTAKEARPVMPPPTGGRRGTSPALLGLQPEPAPPSPAEGDAPPARGARAAERAEDEDEKDNLAALHEKLHQTLCGDAPEEQDDAVGPGPGVWVTECADFSAKYGLCYRLNTGHTGAHFNDSTKMVWEPITDRVEYYARVKVELPQRGGETALFARDQLEAFHMSQHPGTLDKKVTLIKYFKSYLGRARNTKDKVEVVSCSAYVSAQPARITDPHVGEDFVYVKRWLRTPEAIVFRLSNKTVQVCFNDRAEVILSSEWKVVTYTDPSGKRQTLPLSSVATQSEEAADRLRFTKNILYQLIKDHCL
ncbi:polo-like kinase 1 [Strigomonas culicis]|uniref:Serine/threonine-protein kinase PLK n=1 Tax=Strigomonas culicis TaxID=28005 RepID=S9VSN1_9TRYP|nr:polo-like kinase 1 [Strigomonas culicis]|eukprot:EPY26200.1 polo-like kinase 1 [Strigomonas culicis]